MTWINDHWDPEYITMAVETIKETVSLFIRCYPNVVSLIPPPHKMRKYKGDEESPLQGNPADPGGSGAVPAYMSLADQYGIGDDMYIGIPSGGEKTIDQEYQEYVMESPSKRDIDILTFWEVGGDGDINSS